MTAGWVAATVRGRALLTRTVGREGAARIAAADGWDDALARLGPTVYGRGIDPSATPPIARHHAATVAAWQLRVLAGWLPPGGTVLARLAVAPFEIADIERRVAALSGAPAEPLVPLGSLAGVVPLLPAARSLPAVRQVLARSVWRDPGGDDPTDIALGLRIAWAERSIRAAPSTRPWALGALALVAVRERLAFGREPNPATRQRLARHLGRRWSGATDIEEIVARLPEAARWPFAGVHDIDELWRAELAVLDRVARDAHELATSARPGRDTVAAIAALLLVDLWRVTAALDAAAAGGGRPATEVLDAVA